MNLLADAANHWARQLWPISLQVAILVALVYALGLGLRRFPARYRYLLWLVVLIRLAVPAALWSPLGIGQYPERVVSALFQWVKQPGGQHAAGSPASAPKAGLARTDVTAPEELQISLLSNSTHQTVSPVCLAWLSGVLFFGCIIGVRVIQVRRSAGSCHPVDRPGLIDLVRRLAVEVGLKREIKLLQAELPGRLPIPAVHGVLRPVIVLPSSMAVAWDLGALEPVLLHELVHVKRRDCLINTAQIVLQVVYFFHPLVWLANSAIRRERELACDDEVVRRSGGISTSYVRSMMQVAETVAHQPRRQLLGMAMAENASNLGRRIRRMMHSRYRVSEKNALTYLSMVLVAGLLCVAVSAQGWERAAATHQEIISAAVEAPATQSPADTRTQDRKIQEPKGKEVGIGEPKAAAAPAAIVPENAPPKSQERPPGLEPIRVGNAVQESKLTERVAPIMPKAALANGIVGMVMLEAIIDEAGVPVSCRVMLGANASFEEAAMNAVRQWRYAPTLLNGQPVPVITNVVVGFGLPDRIVVDQEGNLRSGDGLPISLDNVREIQGTVVVTPERPAAFAAVERAVKTLLDKGARNIQIISTDYAFRAGRLFYMTLPVAGVSGSVAGVPGGVVGGVKGGVVGGVLGGVPGGVVGGVLGGAPPPPPPPPPPRPKKVEPMRVGGVPGGVGGVQEGGSYGIQPPELDIDLAALGAMAKAAGVSPQAVNTPFGPAPSLSYRVFVSESGEIVTVERLAGPDVPAITSALLQARVLTPGRRGDMPVPVAVMVSIPIR
jgi:TonB family protein